MRNNRTISQDVVQVACLIGLLALSFEVLASEPVAKKAIMATSVTGPSAKYSISIKGYLHGTGTASLNGKTLAITAKVSDDQGNEGDFSAASLTVDATNHFTGTGTALGQEMKISGRLDPMTSKETALKTDRIVCSYKLPGSDGRGRVAGYVPVDPTTAPPQPPVTPPGDD